MMSKLNYFNLFFGFLILSSCNEQSHQPAIIETPIEIATPENIAYATYGEFNEGQLIDTIYSNTYFGFELPVIDGWDIILLNNKAYGDNTQGNEKDSIAKDPSEDNYFQLITLQMNGRVPLVNFMVEKIDPIPNVSNAKEYLAYTETYILADHQTGFPHYIGHAVVESAVGGRSFLNQTFSVEFDTTTQYQRNYCVQFDDYIFTIITHYTNQAELDVINELLAGIIWNN